MASSKPTIPGTFSVPGLPPLLSTTDSQGSPKGGPAHDHASTREGHGFVRTQCDGCDSHVTHVDGNLVNACTQSRNQGERSIPLNNRPNSAMGWRVPISLLAIITATVCSSIRGRKSSNVWTPLLPIGATRHSLPLIGPSLCFANRGMFHRTDDHIAAFSLSAVRKARQLASVPPDVNTTRPS